jgi:hypothetical protein
MVFGRWRDYVLIERQPIEISVNPFQIFRADVIGLKAWARFNAAPRVTQAST